MGRGALGTHEHGGCTELLYVDDSVADAELVRDALSSFSGLNVHSVTDGAEALAYLHQTGEHAGAPRPELVLLDLDLPRVDGRRVLAELKSDLALRAIPVVVFSGSRREADRASAYRLGANGYVVKPAGLTEFRELVRSIYAIWCAAAAVRSNHVT